MSIPSDPSGAPAAGPARTPDTGPSHSPSTAADVAGIAEPGAGPRPLAELMAADWAQAMAPVEGELRAVGRFLREETQAGRSYLPAPTDILRALEQPLADVRVLIVGQDPYPTPGHPMGLSFSVHPSVRPVPRSLQNIFRELHDDLGVAAPASGDLRGWSDQGVLLLNRVLTVRPGQAGSHHGRGWEAFTEHAIRSLAARGGPLAAILWGRAAQSLRPLLGGVPVVASAHPSPLSAHSGFFGSRPFSRVNELLVAQGAEPVDWARANPPA